MFVTFRVEAVRYVWFVCLFLFRDIIIKRWRVWIPVIAQTLPHFYNRPKQRLMLLFLCLEMLDLPAWYFFRIFVIGYLNTISV